MMRQAQLLQRIAPAPARRAGASDVSSVAPGASADVPTALLSVASNDMMVPLPMDCTIGRGLLNTDKQSSGLGSERKLSMRNVRVRVFLWRISAIERCEEPCR